MHWLRNRPVLFATGCGLVVALLGIATGLTWGTGYQTANAVIAGSDVPIWFGAAKFVATLATAVSGIPGGIFAPSLSVGAGIGDVLRSIFPAYPSGAVILLGMVAYFTGVVRAPLTAVIIISETTASRGLMMPLLATALIADFAAQLVSKERLYHGLSKRFEVETKRNVDGLHDAVVVSTIEKR
jgi:H+/Cl- antiporter ClcA